LLDPYLNLVFERDFASTGSDVGPLTLTRPGTYTLLMEGRFFETNPSTYTVVMVPVSDELNPVPFALGATINEAIDEPGEVDNYTFTLAATTSVYFDSLTNNSTIFWSLTGPAGAVSGSRSFTNSDSIDGSGTLNLMAGTYTLTVDGSTDAVGAYSFRLLNLAAATPVTPGVAFSGALNPANETDAFRFDIVGGEKIFFDVTANSNKGNARWRLLDPYLNLVFERDFAIPEAMRER
jgi:hypothetical protein